MSPSSNQHPPRRPPPRLWLRRTDQLAVAVLTLAAWGALAGYWWAAGGWSGRLIEIERAEPQTASFQVDINRADWPELAELPGVGQTLARRIVESRRAAGPFADHRDLLRVPGIGPRTLERLQPFLLPMAETANVAAE